MINPEDIFQPLSMATHVIWTVPEIDARDGRYALLAVGGPLAGSAGRLIGTGSGRGIALLLIALGLTIVLTVAVFFRYPRLRRLESELPDFLPEGVNS